MTKHYLGAMLGVALIAATGYGQPPPLAVALPADLTVPSGFKASVFASDLAGARLMAVSPEGVPGRWTASQRSGRAARHGQGR